MNDNDTMNCDHLLEGVGQRTEPSEECGRIIITNKCKWCGQVEEDIYNYSDTIFL